MRQSKEKKRVALISKQFQKVSNFNGTYTTLLQLLVYSSPWLEDIILLSSLLHDVDDILIMLCSEVEEGMVPKENENP